MTTHPIRIGSSSNRSTPTTGDPSHVREAEDLGVDVIFNWDHFYPSTATPTASTSSAGRCWGPGRSRRPTCEIGALVTCNSYRNPELLADMARTVDHMSDGRLIFGIGSGWFEKDYDEYGYEFGTAGGRLNELAEDLPRIESRWAKLNPAPTRNIPVLIGGGGEQKTLRLVAQHADLWHSFSDLDAPRKSAILDSHCAEIGRDPGEIARSVGTPEEGPARPARRCWRPGRRCSPSASAARTTTSAS